MSPIPFLLVGHVYLEVGFFDLGREVDLVPPARSCRSDTGVGRSREAAVPVDL